MKSKSIISLFSIMLSACAIPGFGPYAADVVDGFIGTKFSNPNYPKKNKATGNLYSHTGSGNEWVFNEAQEESGTRYYIKYYKFRCKYSIYVDRDDIIRSWRDEGGPQPMNTCLVH